MNLTEQLQAILSLKKGEAETLLNKNKPASLKKKVSKIATKSVVKRMLSDVKDVRSNALKFANYLLRVEKLTESWSEILKLAWSFAKEKIKAARRIKDIIDLGNSKKAESSDGIASYYDQTDSYSKRRNNIQIINQT